MKKRKIKFEGTIFDNCMVLELPQGVIVELPHREGGGEFSAKELLVIPLKGVMPRQTIEDISHLDEVYAAAAYSLVRQAAFAVLKKGAHTSTVMHRIVHILRKRGR